MKTILFAALAGALMVLLAGGCQIIDQSRMQKNEESQVLWNRRADWEDQALGVPY